jgi:transposase
MKRTSIVRNGERYFGVDIDAGGIVVAERVDGRALGAARYPAGPAGIDAVRSHIARTSAHPHVCIRSCGAAAMSLAVALMAVEGVEVTIVSPQTVKEPAARAEQLARLAERLF